MVFMGVRNHNGQKVFAKRFHKADIGQYQVDARQIWPWKCYTAVYHNPFAFCGIAETIKREVHADFTNATQWYENQILFTQGYPLIDRYRSF